MLSEPDPPAGDFLDDEDEERTTAVESACMNEAWTVGRLLGQLRREGGLHFPAEPVRSPDAEGSLVRTPRPRPGNPIFVTAFDPFWHSEKEKP